MSLILLKKLNATVLEPESNRNAGINLSGLVSCVSALITKI